MHRKQIDGLDLHLVSIAAISGNIWTIRWSAGNARESFDGSQLEDGSTSFNTGERPRRDIGKAWLQERVRKLDRPPSENEST